MRAAGVSLHGSSEWWVSGAEASTLAGTDLQGAKHYSLSLNTQNGTGAEGRLALPSVRFADGSAGGVTWGEYEKSSVGSRVRKRKRGRARATGGISTASGRING